MILVEMRYFIFLGSLKQFMDLHTKIFQRMLFKYCHRSFLSKISPTLKKKVLLFKNKKKIFKKGKV